MNCKFKIIKWILFFLKIFLILISLLISFSFLTLYERKIIAIRQIRVSPQFNIINGLVQPFLDALKLLTKRFYSRENNFFINKYLFVFSTVILIMYFHFWITLFLLKGEILNSRFRILCFLSLLRVSLYTLIFLRFFSLSKYPFFSLLRLISQSISYEINFSLIIFFFIIIIKTLNFSKIVYLENSIFVHFRLIIILILIRIIESFRSPYDFRESESELVSGFTSELGSLKFIFIFIAEYRILLFYIVFLSIIFSINLLVFISLICFVFIFRRSVLPRIRYDYLINFCWKNIFPFITFIIFIYLI